MTTLKGWSSQAPRVRPIPHQTNGPGPVPCLGMGPETPCVPKEGKLRADSRGLGPPWGSGISCVHPDLPYCVGVRSHHVSRRHEFGREPSAGRLARLPHSMLVVEACSATTARGAAFVRPHCASRITKIHSSAAPAQSPSAALIGYDGTALFHHATYATPQATWPFSYVAGDAAGYAWHHSDKTAPGHAERETPGAGKDIRRKIFFTYDAIMYEQYVILYYIAGPTCRGPSSHVRASFKI